MGNYLSSTLNKTSSSSSSSAKVILPDGKLRYINSPTKAAELMMEIPSFFLVEAKSLKIGRKFCPLSADDDLQIKGGHVYICFPMSRATSAANASDLARLFLAAAKKQPRGRGRRTGSSSGGAGKYCNNGRVSPDEEDEEEVKVVTTVGGGKLNLEEIEDAVEFMHRISVSKSKKPKLETIVEESLS